MILGALLVLLSNGRWILPAAAWWAPVFMLRFLRTQSAAVALTVGLAASCAVMLFAWRGMLPVPHPFYFMIATVIGVMYFLPYALDRLIAPRLGGFASTLVLPLAWASVEYLDAVLAPYGTWGSAAYSQVDNLPLIQLVSVTGLWGVSFLLAWFASTVNWAWELSFEWSRIRSGSICFVSVLSTVLLMGLATLTPGRRQWQDQIVALAPDGSLALRYHKHPGGRERSGDRKSGMERMPPIIETPLGRLGVALCQDMDYQQLILQQGRARADFIVVPSANWKEIDQIHTRMALVRGIENGCSVVRQTIGGLSAAADYEGQIRSAVDYFQEPDRTMISEIPSRGVHTIYARIGDLFAWLSLAGLVLLAIVAIVRPVRTRL